MKIERVFLYVFASMFYVTFVGAIFFTDSKNTDYPRIGKRLPSSVYKAWLTENEKIEYSPYTYESRHDSTKRQLVLPRTHDGFYPENDDFNGSKGPTTVQLPEGIANRDLYKRIIFYLTSDDDLGF